MAKTMEGNPWLSIWINTRQTIRAIVNSDPKRGFVFLSAVYGFPIASNFAQNLSLSATVPIWAIVIGALILSTFVGMLGITICTWLLKVTGSWIGGKGTFQTIRTAVAWSNVPSIVTVLMWFVLLGFFGGQVYNREFAETSFIGYEAGIVFLVFLIQTIVSIWGFVILVNALGEVQGFSAWKALLNIIIPFVIIVAVVWLMAWVMGGVNQSIK